MKDLCNYDVKVHITTPVDVCKMLLQQLEANYRKNERALQHLASVKH